MKSINEKKHHYDSCYDNKIRFISYWYQKDEILKLNPASVLEIGIGNGFLSEYLKKRNIKITTLDICKNLKPDIIASVTSVPTGDAKFELVACFETLEHLPYESFPKALSEIHRVCSKYVIMSLPDSERYCRLYLKIPKIHEVKILARIRKIKMPEHQYDGQHYWEIGKSGYQLKAVLSKIKNAGFEIKKTYRVFEAPYFRFFILKKINRL